MTFGRAVAFVLWHEGDSSDDPRDPGGKTRFGISALAYPHLNIDALTEADAVAIYRRDYWDRIKGDLLPPAVAFLVFDAAVNQGPRRAVSWLQHAVGTKPDGIMGPETIAAAAKADLRAVISEYAARRMWAYGTTPSFQTFGLGWSRRLADAILTAREIQA